MPETHALSPTSTVVVMVILTCAKLKSSATHLNPEVAAPLSQPMVFVEKKLKFPKNSNFDIF